VVAVKKSKSLGSPGPGVPRNPTEDLLAQAERHFGAGRLAEAEALCMQILAVDVRHAGCLYLLGVLGYSTGRYEMAVRMIQRSIAIGGGTASSFSDLGCALQAQGKLTEAAAAFRQALTLKPDFAEACYNLGNTCRDLGQPDDAVAAFQRALELKPGHVDALNNLGLLLGSQGKQEAAEDCFRRGIALSPQTPQAHYNLGRLLHRTPGRLPEAMSHYERALTLEPDYLEAHYNLGNAFQAQGRAAEAATSYERVVALKPEFAEGHCKLGDALQRLGKFHQAVACYERALAIRPEYAQAHTNLGAAFQNLGQLDQAKDSYEQALALKPDSAETLSNLGAVFNEQGRFDHAAACLERALALEPHDAATLNNFGNTLREQGRLDEAVALYGQALTFQPDYADAHCNLGNAYQDQSKFEEALGCYERALALNPAFANAHWNRSLVQLLLGDLAAGFRNYESRSNQRKVAPRSFPQPQWRGEPLHGARILLHAEQGLGDSIQFVRYVPMVQAAGGTVVLDLPGRLRRIAAGLPGVAGLVDSGDPLPPFDWHCPLMSLPLAFATNLDTIPAQVPYLTVPAEAARAAAGLNWPTEGLRVGLAWAGSPIHTRDRIRSMPLHVLDPLFSVEDVHFFSLQMGEPAAQLSRSKSEIVDLGALTGDMADTAAQIAHLDLVITVDTAIAHLAGALAKPTWILLPSSADWRWLRDREDSPWYPTVRLYRQPKPGDWPAVVAAVRDALVETAALHSPSSSPQRGKIPEAVSVTIQSLLAQALQQYADASFNEAERTCLEILALDVRHGESLYLLGVIGYRTGRYGMSVSMIRRAIATNKTQPAYHCLLGSAFQAQGQLDEAVASFERALALKPDYAEACFNLGNARRAQSELEQAAAAFRRALTIKHDYFEAWNNLGLVLQDLNQFDQAAASFDRTLTLNPQAAEGHYNLGRLRHLQNGYAEATTRYERALALRPDYPDARVNLALIQLLQGDFESGWRNYEWRDRQPHGPRRFQQPRWRGEPLGGARILLHPEQGLGDTLQFLRFVPQVQAAGGTVILDLPKRLRRLGEQFPGIAALVNTGDPLPPFDCECPLMSLPGVLGITRDSIPAQVPYLTIPNEALKDAIALPWPKAGLRVGLAWAGSPTNTRDRFRSMPLSLLAPLFEIKGLHFFSLQMGPPAAQLAGVDADIVNLEQTTTDMADTAAQMAALDLVISVDTAVAHLAGALAKPVWVLLPFAPDWRWMLERQDSPWYPTVRLFRQPEPGDWHSVVAAVRAELVRLADQLSI